MQVSTSIYTLGGLDVVAEFDPQDEQCFWIVQVGERDCSAKVSDWLNRRMNKRSINRILEARDEAYRDGADDKGDYEYDRRYN